MSSTFGYQKLVGSFITGILSAGLGIILLTKPVFASVFIVAMVAIAFMIYGIFRIYWSFKLKSSKEKL